jgi:hypothetical protein
MAICAPRLSANVRRTKNLFTVRSKGGSMVDVRPFVISHERMDQIRTSLLAMKRHARHLAKIGRIQDASLFVLNLDRIHLNILNLPRTEGGSN